MSPNYRFCLYWYLRDSFRSFSIFGEVQPFGLKVSKLSSLGLLSGAFLLFGKFV